MHRYGLRDHAGMIADVHRTGAYMEALRRTLTPGCTVVDVGTGSGVLAMAACRFGAARVFAIEAGEVIALARELAADNGFSDRIEFIHAMSHDVRLPERADVIVSDLHGVLPLFESSVATLADARQRFLKPGGTMIPLRETIRAAVVEDARMHERFVGVWSDDVFGLDLRRGSQHAASEIYRGEFEACQQVTTQATWVTLEYLAADAGAATGRVNMTATRSGTGHGVALWFDSTLADGVELSNAPGKPVTIFGQSFLAWPRPVALEAGDIVEAGISARPLHDRYLWQWKSRVMRAGHERAAFEQSQFDAVPITSQALRRRAASATTALSDEGEMHLEVLTRMARGQSVGDIARDLQAAHPKRFSTWHEALDWVGELALKFGD